MSLYNKGKVKIFFNLKSIHRNQEIINEIDINMN